ncbi:MAG: transcriptional repressor LexA [Maledivibacter sp.]|jgi:repressor LexA|nr:transcriptional repressor LexA [Maledivibacter sp.]
MHRTKLTERQTDILGFIESEFTKKGYPPTVREICKAVGLSSTSTVHGHLTRLVKKGYLTKEDYKPRSLSSIKTDDSYMLNVINETYIQIPVVKNVVDIIPILAVENIETTFPVPIDFIESGTHFLLKIQDNSMLEAGILDNDYVLVKQQSFADNGDIVAAHINGSATVKRFFKDSHYIRLQPKNSSMQPIILPEVTLLGLVKGVFRKL